MAEKDLLVRRAELLEQLRELDYALGRLCRAPVSVDTRLDHCELSTKTRNCLKNDSMWTVGDLYQHSQASLLRVPNLGRKSLEEIKAMLHFHNLPNLSLA